MIVPRWARPGLHTWLGLVIVFAVAVHWAVGLIFAAYFALYERWEADRIRDRAYQSLAQAMWGVAIGSVVWAIVKLLV